MQRHVIIVAGGKGLRMGADIPKQFLPIQGRPLLMHTLETFHSFDAALSLTLVLPPAQQDYWRQLCREHDFHIPHQIADGGETRFQSVSNGLAALSEATDDALVAVHDGVRPFVAPSVIEACFESAALHGAALPVVPVVETLRHLDGDTLTATHTVPRSEYRLVQTPQTFRLGLLREAYRQPYDDAFTDDASVVEALGHPITLVEGNRENIKITTPFDLTIAEALCQK